MAPNPIRRTLLESAVVADGEFPGSRGWSLLLALALGCSAGQATDGEDGRVTERHRMVSGQIEARGVRDPRVFEAMREIPRHLFVPESLRPQAYEDRALPIAGRQTISQPYVVAWMTELAEVRPGDRVLEIGTGSGYQAAVLAHLGAEVFTIELLASLSETAEATIRELGHRNVRFRIGDGYAGWPEEAPFDRIVVTAAPPEIPEALLEQLGPGGRLVAPVGPEGGDQRLVVAEREPSGSIRFEDHGAVFFVPMVPGQESGS